MSTEKDDKKKQTIQLLPDIYATDKRMQYTYILNGKIPLPFFRPYNLKTTSLDAPPIDGGILMEACAPKIVTGGVLGSVLGIGMGIFFGAMNDPSPIRIVQGKEVPQSPVREVMRSAFKATWKSSLGWAKSFGVMTALFGGIECVIEKERATKDVWNSVFSGCVVGATMAANSGPTSMCFGCVGFGLFSMAADAIMGGH